MNPIYRKLKTWLSLSAVIFLMLVLINLALPAVFLLLRVPSFAVGDQGWILRWQNDAEGSGIQFNLTFLFVNAILVGLILVFIKTRTRF